VHSPIEEETVPNRGYSFFSSERNRTRCLGRSIACGLLMASLGAVPMARAQATTAEEAQLEGLHTVYRLTHCGTAAVWLPTLAQAAADWAARSPQAADGSFSHDQNRGPYGENLAWGTNLTGIDAIQLWYNESRLYNYASPGFSPQTGHFTQVVWIASPGVGMAMVRRGNVNLWVARYNGPGNIEGMFQFMVAPPFGPFGSPGCPGFPRERTNLIGKVPPATLNTLNIR
jgi:uncharacterized protein YkwD